MLTIAGKYFSRPQWEYENAYIVCQYLSEKVRQCGFDGVSYTSLYSGKQNYTLFHFSDSFIEWKESRPLLVVHSGWDIYDINKGFDPIDRPKECIKIDHDSILEFLSTNVEKWEEHESNG